MPPLLAETPKPRGVFFSGYPLIAAELNAKVQLDEIHKTGKLGDELVNSLKQSIENFKKGFSV